ncbi:uncharacterized protein L969DRAFT_167264 [Mixia osmundae IAM 14324]|uniref:alanine--glyoxylate transaminase n=1 Tax=Mixia osmundae (strain CBS 9802 / IAM 14324 / JCM 22182 / KY 12970) TaxID=764103 RepID=G7E572_MIXOS|nr:uncharacterized protein L969DRAFT_167264 [Mixia osmundae IAM 14324]KEI42661.1 hypothetical protein L969DRAFT_167264 [Mixia osmundae IAM 14324]GAA97982.1 hypothetical protein E5Q_04662 [Mixia osmundae IAM 14324]
MATSGGPPKAAKDLIASEGIDLFRQEAHPLLTIPGPVEIADKVLFANAHSSVGHTTAAFINVFRECIELTQALLGAHRAQPFLVAGSGTLGWDMVAANLIEQQDKALVLSTGYFSDAFADALRAYGASVDVLATPLGHAPDQSQVRKALRSNSYKICTITHVDTSTGVLADIKQLAKIIKTISPGTLVIVDAVCSVASEDIQFDAWGLDVLLTSSQKGLGVPPGLSITVASQQALRALEERKTPVAAYFADWQRWLPIMRAYAEGRPAYFSTPPTNLIFALQASLKTIMTETPDLATRLRLHRETSYFLKSSLSSIGLKQIPAHYSCSANGMTTVYLPDKIAPAAVMGAMAKRGIVIAGGLHKDVKDRYIRIGHMNLTAIDNERQDIARVFEALKSTLAELGYTPAAVPKSTQTSQFSPSQASVSAKSRL